MQLDPDTKAASYGSQFVAFDPRPQPKVEDNAQPEAKHFLGEVPEFALDLLLEPSAHIHSSFVRRRASRSAASCVASVVLPAPGNPQVRMSRAWFTASTIARCTTAAHGLLTWTGQCVSTSARRFVVEVHAPTGENDPLDVDVDSQRARCFAAIGTPPMK